MGLPEEIPNITQFPLSPRMARGVDVSAESQEKPSVGTVKRSLTPLQNTKVEFWHQGERSVERQVTVPRKRIDHARRSDQMGVLMIIIAMVILALGAAAMHLNNKKYSFNGSLGKKSVTPMVDFYQGNQAFSKKVKDEKTGSRTSDLPVPEANDDFEISLQAQMASMNQKLEKMRSQKLLEEPPIPMPDKGPQPAPIIGVRPTETKNFKSPLEFNGMLPKTLQQGE
ncbi:MAG: hypothetical protein RLZZ408_109 [Verrucomicrobiota bacterium]|jgi:hypothetical protein